MISFILQLYAAVSKGVNFTHLHYLGWPDFGAPDSPEPIISLVKDVRKLITTTLKTTKNQPKINVLVHCSAGVGRTGTFIALYKIMEQLDYLVPKFDFSEVNKNKTIDIFNTAFKLRSKRVFMVSHERK